MQVKPILFLLALLAVSACGTQTRKAIDSADSMSTDSVIVPGESYIPQRADYTFRSEVRTVN